MKIWKQKEIDKKIFDTFVASGKSPLASAIIATRKVKIDDADKLKAFISPNIRQIEDSSNIYGLSGMAEIIFKNKYSSVAIFGDYDVDGIFSTFMLGEILKACGTKSIIPIIPDRMKDGYGLNDKSVKTICKRVKDCKIDAVFFLDCGTNSKEYVDIIKKKIGNPDVLIVDHHIVDKDSFSSNATAIVNHRMGDRSSAYCTAALVYFLSKEMQKFGINMTEDMLPYAAIGSIADVSDLDINNRIIVYNGLKRLKKIKNVGIGELIKVCGIDAENCKVEDISFKLAPRINANGRVDRAEFALELLHCEDEEEAFQKSIKIDSLNDARKKHQKRIFSEALEQIDDNPNRESVLVYNKNWKSGVVGIVASKLVEKFGVPALVFGGEDEIKGSGRSVGEINIKEVMDIVPHLFVRYGGHEMAAGASLNRESLKTAAEDFDKAVSEYKKKHKIHGVVIEYDIKLKNSTFRKIDNSFCQNIHKFEPFGQGNENILFRVNDVYCKSVKEWGSGSGGFVEIEGLKMDCFVYEQNSSKLSDTKLDILFQIERNFKDDEDWAVVIREYIKK